jgi:hypothetical protein
MREAFEPFIGFGIWNLSGGRVLLVLSLEDPARPPVVPAAPDMRTAIWQRQMHARLDIL